MNYLLKHIVSGLKEKEMVNPIETFCFDDNTNEIVFGNEENGIRLSSGDITYIRNGRRVSFDDVTKEVLLIELAPRMHGKWLKRERCSSCSNCGDEAYKLWVDNGEKWVPITMIRFCENCEAIIDLEGFNEQSN